jgi:spermidine synthase
MTAGSFLLHPSVERVVICEMESSVVKASRENFALENHGVLGDRRTQIVIDDARHFLATTKEKFDVITTDPIHPWVRGAAALYTTEFLQMCRDHLNRGGVVAQWIPLYESNEAAVKCELATFMEAFPFATIWSGESRAKGYDVIAIGTEASSFEPNELARRAARIPKVCQSLAELEIDPDGLEHLFAAYGVDLKEWLRGSQINRDCNLRLQYLAGLSPDGRIAQSMMEQMSIQRPIPTESLSAARDTEDRLNSSDR